MADVRFDPSGFYEFNLAQGAVRTREGTRLVVLTEALAGRLLAAAAKAEGNTIIRKFGKALGKQIVASAGDDASELPPEVVLGHATAVLALFGWGRLSMERWGAALVLELSGGPDVDADRLVVAALLGGLLTVLAGRETACVPVESSHFIVLDPTVAETVWSWSHGGQTRGQIVSRLEARLPTLVEEA